MKCKENACLTINSISARLIHGCLATILLIFTLVASLSSARAEDCPATARQGSFRMGTSDNYESLQTVPGVPCVGPFAKNRGTYTQTGLTQVGTPSLQCGFLTMYQDQDYFYYRYIPEPDKIRCWDHFDLQVTAAWPGDPQNYLMTIHYAVYVDAPTVNSEGDPGEADGGGNPQ